MKSKEVDKEDLDPSLDFFSPQFDPLKAIYTLKKIPSTLPKVKALDNLSKCHFLLPPDDPNYMSLKKKNTKPEIPEFEKKIQGFYFLSFFFFFFDFFISSRN